MKRSSRVSFVSQCTTSSTEYALAGSMFDGASMRYSRAASIGGTGYVVSPPGAVNGGCRGSASRLFGLDARDLDHFRPLFGGLKEDRPEFRGRAPGHRAAQFNDPGLDLGIGEAG